MACVAGVRGFFVAGTDTGVGKTEVARALLSLLRGAVPLKPVETGCAEGHPEDALALLRASGGNFELDRVCPYRFRLPAARRRGGGREDGLDRAHRASRRAGVPEPGGGRGGGRAVRPARAGGGGPDGGAGRPRRARARRRAGDEPRL